MSIKAKRLASKVMLTHLSTQRDSGGHGSPVYPEGHPGEHHHQHGGEVRLKHEEEDMPPENEVYVEPIVPTWNEEAESSSRHRCKDIAHFF